MIADADATVITLWLLHIVLNEKRKVKNFENALEFPLNKGVDKVVIIKKLIKVSLLNSNKNIMFNDWLTYSNYYCNYGDDDYWCWCWSYSYNSMLDAYSFKRMKKNVKNFENALEFPLNKGVDKVVIIDKIIKVSLLNSNQIIMFDVIDNGCNTEH